MNVSEQITDRIYGVDLGTTYSCISYVDEASGVPVIVSNAEDQLTTPSVVYFGPNKQVEVGQSAKNNSAIDPERVVAFVKRDMGTDRVITIDGAAYKPEEVSALILKKLVDNATDRLREQQKLHFPIKRVVITVPAYFGQREREATITAGKLAGLDVVNILNEPTAAALSYRASGTGNDEISLVYDLGGGTFDITLLDISGSTIREVAIAGNSRRGGYDWDNALLDLIIERFLEKHAELSAARSDELWRKAMLELAEKMKKDLSRYETSKQVVTYGTVAATIEIKRSEFEDATAALLSGTFDLVADVLAKVTEESMKPKKVYLVGGSTKMKAVPNRLTEFLAERLKHEIEIVPKDPDLAVAKGAAFQAFILRLKEIVQGNSGDYGPVIALFPNVLQHILATPVYTVLSRALGFRVRRRNDKQLFIDHLIMNNDPLPAQASKTYITSEDKQSEIGLAIYEQAGAEPSEEPEHNSQIGEMVISGLRAFSLPQGSPVEASLEVEADGTVRAKAREPKSGKEVSTTLKIVGSMNDRDLMEAREKLNTLEVNVQ